VVGDIAFRFVKKATASRDASSTSIPHVKVVDINPSMLEVGKSRSKDQLNLHQRMNGLLYALIHLVFVDRVYDFLGGRKC
jgi:ubiquinone/menaquinone biosynthesis C-methylase UbiE